MKTDDNPLVTFLAIDDDPQNLDLITAALEQPGLHILTAADPETGLDLFYRKLPRIVLCDLMMPKLTGMEVLEKIISADPGTEVILMTAHYSTDSAVEAIQKGACDYLEKPISTPRLRKKIDGLIEAAQERQRCSDLQREMLAANRFEELVGSSPLMLEIFAKIQRV